VRRLAEDELWGHFQKSLETLQHLAKVFDDGHSPIAFSMATEVYKILTENSSATRLRANKIFTTPSFDAGPNIISAVHKLTLVSFGGTPPAISFDPIFYGVSYGVENLDFRTWWNRDVIFRASAALPGTPPGILPVNDTPAVPFEKREKLTRMRFVQLLRNKAGSHLESEWPMLFDELDDEKGWGGFAIHTPDGEFSTENGTLSIRRRQVGSMMRQITHELLIAYDFADGPPESGK